MNKRDLIDDQVLHVNSALAKVLGLQEAIILSEIHFQMGVNAEKNDYTKSADKRVWVIRTYKQWHEQMAWWSEKTIRRCLQRLRVTGLVLTRCAKHSYDHTLYYSIDFDALAQYLADNGIELASNRVGADGVQSGQD